MSLGVGNGRAGETHGRQAVVHEWDPEQGIMQPVWFLIDSACLDWSERLVVRPEAPFQSISFDELDCDVLSLAVPDHVYVRHPGRPGVIAIDMPELARYAERLFAVSKRPPLPGDIGRLLLRIPDIEDMLLYKPNKRRKR